MRIAVLVIDGVFDTGLACVCDVFALANVFAEAPPPFDVVRFGVRKRVRTAHGLTVPLETRPRRVPDVVVVPALGAKTPESLDTALARPEVKDAKDLLAHWHARGSRIAAACTATFLLGSAGLLDGKAATTTWWLAQAFRERFPAVRLDESQMLVDAGQVLTAGAALAHLDLALWLVRGVSPSLARTTARHIAFDSRPSQSMFSATYRLVHSDSLVERFEAWTRAHLNSFSVTRAARAIGVSQRTLERRVHDVLGKSPLVFVQDLRIADALHQLESTDRTVDDIAVRVGYQAGTTLRTLLRRRTGLGVRALRSRR